MSAQNDETLSGRIDLIHDAIRISQERQFGVVDTGFLCQSVSILNPRRPHCVQPETSVGQVIGLLQQLKIGCLLVVGEDGRLAGLISERDLVKKAFSPDKAAELNEPVSHFMTPDPVARPPDTTVAHALNLMSDGGFRHLPIVDEDNVPIGIISVKDVVDYIVSSYTKALLDFPIPE